MATKPVKKPTAPAQKAAPRTTEPAEPPKIGFWRDRTKVLAVLAILMMVVGSLLARAINTGGGTVKVTEVSFIGASGNQISANVYMPASATAQTPAPAVAMWHGLNNQKEYMSHTALELARRGYVVVNADQTGHGSSNGANQTAGCGGPDTLKYIQGLAGVDPKRIGLVGMSQGGFCAATAAALSQPDGYASIFYMESEPEAPGTTDVTAYAAFRNAAVIIGSWTELGGMIAVDKGANAVNSPPLKAFFGTDQPIVIGQLYGSIADGTARLLYTAPEDHALSTVSTGAIGATIDWMDKTLNGGQVSSPTGQVWPWMLIGTSIALFGAFIFVFVGGRLLLRTKTFAGLVRPVPVYRGLRGPGWWIGAVITTALGPLLYLFVWKHMFFTPWFNTNSLWPQTFTNIYMAWAVIIGVIACALIVLNHFAFTKRQGGTLTNYGVAEADGGIAWDKVGRSVLFGLAVLAPIYLILAFVHGMWHVDFRMWVVNIMPFTVPRLLAFFGYLVPFAIYYFAQGILFNGFLRWRGGKGPLWQEMLVNSIVMTLGAFVWLLIAYIPLWNGGAMIMSSNPMTLMVAGMGAIYYIPMLVLWPVVACLWTYFYRKTGRTYVGSVLVTLLVVWSLVASGDFGMWPILG